VPTRSVGPSTSQKAELMDCEDAKRKVRGLLPRCRGDSAYGEKLHPRCDHLGPQFSLPLTLRLVDSFGDGSEPLPGSLHLIPLFAMIQVLEHGAEDERVATDALHWRDSVVGITKLGARKGGRKVRESRDRTGGKGR